MPVPVLDLVGEEELAELGDVIESGRGCPFDRDRHHDEPAHVRLRLRDDAETARHQAERFMVANRQHAA